GIDIVYYGNQGRLEYDFIVSPGASPQIIDVRFDGAAGLTLTPEGDLMITAAAGSGRAIRQSKPVAYQIIDGRKAYVTADYVLHNTNRARFQIGKYDRTRPLVIDPQLVYSIFGNTATIAKAIA